MRETDTMIGPKDSSLIEAFRRQSTAKTQYDGTVCITL